MVKKLRALRPAQSATGKLREQLLHDINARNATDDLETLHKGLEAANDDHEGVMAKKLKRALKEAESAANENHPNPGMTLGLYLAA